MSTSNKRVALPNRFNWLNDGETMTFPIQSGRYSVSTLDYTQSPSVDTLGCFDSIEAAIHHAASVLDTVDYAHIWDNKRGYMVARGK